jgi:hypothetical protein
VFLSEEPQVFLEAGVEMSSTQMSRN